MTPVKTAVFDVLGMVLLFSFCVVITNPMGNFPVYDDWSFGLAVQHLTATGDFRPTGWTSMPLIMQTVWGSLFCLPAGFSFDTLRFSTLTLALLAMVATYSLMRELRQPRWLTIVASLTLAFSPIFYVLSHTFMTDVPYTAITIVTAVCWVRYLRTGATRPLLIGTFSAVAATLTRQTALCLPLAFGIALLLKHGCGWRNILRATLPLVLCGGVLVTFQRWLEVTGRLPALYYMKNDELRYALTHLQTSLILAKNVFVIVLYLGLFLLPVLIFIFWGWWAAHRKQTTGILVLSAIIFINTAVLDARLFGGRFLLMPNGVNLMTKEGFSPNSLHDAAILNLNKIPLPDGFWLVVTAFSMVGAILLVTVTVLSANRLIVKMRAASLSVTEAAGVFLLLSAAIYLSPFLVSHFYDRYLVPPVPLLMAGLAAVGWFHQRTDVRIMAFRSIFILAVALLSAYAVFTVCATRDFLTWNRLRWEALNCLMKNQRVEAKDIDGGFEFNGLYFYNPQYTSNPLKSPWWVQNDTYRIGFGNMPGYTIVKEYGYSHWLPPHRGKIVILKVTAPKGSKIQGE